VLYVVLHVGNPLEPKSRTDGWPRDADDIRTLIRDVHGQRVQMGAGATTGRGIVLCKLLETTEGRNG
jgi:hypothetical protein